MIVSSQTTPRSIVQKQSFVSLHFRLMPDEHNEALGMDHVPVSLM